jgi:hypothetical protein
MLLVGWEPDTALAMQQVSALPQLGLVGLDTG